MTELIPRSVLFGNPEKTSPALSPDGTRIAYLAPHDNVLSVWVRTLGVDDDHVVASDPARPIRNAFWSPGGDRVMYLQDAGGDENFHLFAADPGGTQPAIDLTPYEGARVAVQSIDYRRPEVMLIAMNRRDPQLFDVYRLDPVTGTATLDTQNPGTVAAFADDVTMTVRAGVIQHEDASTEIIVRDDAASPWRTMARFDPDDGTPMVAGFTLDGGGLLAITSSGANAARLVCFDGPRAPEQAAAEDLAGRQRIWPAIHGLSGLVGIYVLRGSDLSSVIVTLTTSVETLDAAQRAVMATGLAPDEDPALLPGPDRIEIHRVTAYQLPAAGPAANTTGR